MMYRICTPMHALARAQYLIWRKRRAVYSPKAARINLVPNQGWGLVRAGGNSTVWRSLHQAGSIRNASLRCRVAGIDTRQTIAQRHGAKGTWATSQAFFSNTPFSNTLSSPGTKLVQVSSVVSGVVTTMATRSLGCVWSAKLMLRSSSLSLACVKG